MAELEYEKHDVYAIFTLNRPERLNALGGTLMAELNEAMADFDADPRMRVGRGVGRRQRGARAGATDPSGGRDRADDRRERAAVRAGHQGRGAGLADGDIDHSCRLYQWIDAVVLDSEDAREGPQAFAEKREPVWKER